MERDSVEKSLIPAVTSLLAAMEKLPHTGDARESLSVVVIRFPDGSFGTEVTYQPDEATEFMAEGDGASASQTCRDLAEKIDNGGKTDAEMKAESSDANR